MTSDFEAFDGGGADITEAAVEGWTATMLAARNGNTAISPHLCEARHDVISGPARAKTLTTVSG